MVQPWNTKLLCQPQQPIYGYLFTRVLPGPHSDHFGAFHSVELAYEFNTLDILEGRDLTEKRLTEIAEHTATAFGAVARVNYQRNYPVMINSEEETQHAIAAATKVSGACALEPPTMGGEDFAFFLEERPGAYIFVGNGDSAKVHNTTYDFNDEAIPAGCSWWVEIVEGRLPA